MMKKKEEIPFSFYHHIQEKLWDISKRGELSRKKATDCMYWWRIEKRMRPIILKELEFLGLIEISKFSVKVIKPKMDRENFIKKANRQIGLF